MRVTRYLIVVCRCTSRHRLFGFIPSFYGQSDRLRLMLTEVNAVAALWGCAIGVLMAVSTQWTGHGPLLFVLASVLVLLLG